MVVPIWRSSAGDAARLTKEEEALVLDGVPQGVDRVVVVDGACRGIEIALEQRVGATAHRRGRERGEAHDVPAEVFDSTGGRSMHVTSS